MMPDLNWLARTQRKSNELIPEVAATMKKLRELKALKDMKITDTNWQLPIGSASQMDEVVRYSEARGLPWSRVGKDYNPNFPVVYFVNVGVLSHGRKSSSDILVSVAAFKAMCDEYAAEKADQSTGINPTLTVGQALGIDRGEFYCLMDGGTTPPRIIHPTLEAAKTEARRLIEAHNKPVRILRAMLEIKPADRYIETQL